MAVDQGGSNRVIVIALFANLGIALAKFFGAYISKSASLLAEAIHSVVDCSNQALLLIGSRQAKRAPSETHPLGYGRESFFWSFIVAILLFSLGGIFAIYEGVHKLVDHSELKSPWVALTILLLSIFLESYSCLACIREVRAQNRYPSLWQWFKKTKSVELLVIFTEDLAALMGLIVATLFLLLSWITGNPFWDACGSIVIGSVLVIVAVVLAIEIKSLIVGETSELDLKPFLSHQIEQMFPRGRLLNLITLQIGANDVMLACKFHPGELTEIGELVNRINLLEKKLKLTYPQIKFQFIEPDSSV